MKRFQLKFDLKYHIAVYVGIALCAILLALNIVRIVNNGFGNTYSTITYVLIFLLALFAPVLLLSILYHSFYIVENGKFITQFGFIKSAYSVSDFTELVYDEKKKLLNIVMGEQYMVFKVDSSWLKEFVSALKEVKGSIIYNETDEPTPLPPPDRSKKEK